MNKDLFESPADGAAVLVPADKAGNAMDGKQLFIAEGSGAPPKFNDVFASEDIQGVYP